MVLLRCVPSVCIAVMLLLTLKFCMYVFQPNTEGFLVMLLPRKQEQSTEMQRLSSAEAYEQLLTTRQKTMSSS